MKKLYKPLFIAGLLLASQQSAFSGGANRTGQAGASELLINPWSRSSGWAGLNTANSSGLESMNLNVAGLARTTGTELVFARTNYLVGSDIAINAFGFSQKLGASNVIGVTIMSIDFGDIPITTYDSPEGGIGTYSPQFVNFGLGFAHSFSSNISGGFVLRGITEAVTNVKAQGFALDAGVQYTTGKRKQTKFGVALRNIGPPMGFTGDGLSTKATNAAGVVQTFNAKSQAFELPSLLNIGASYDINMGQNHRFTLASNFTSNSFTQDRIGLGGEYAFKSYLMVRGGYNYEQGILDYKTRLTAFTGGSVGATIELPLGKNGSTFALDYSFVGSYVFQGNHSFGARLKF